MRQRNVAAVDNPTRRPFLRSVLLTGVTVVIFLLMGAGLSGIFTRELGVRATLVAVAAAAIPLAVVVPTYLWLDRYEAEPLRLQLFAFGWGALVAPVVALVLNTGSLMALRDLGILHAETVEAVYVAPMIEESLKGLAILFILWFHRHELDSLVDGLVYAGLVGAGFAFSENVLYLGKSLVEGDTEALTAVFLLRGVLGPFAHPLFTSCIGLAIGLATVVRPLLGRVALIVGGWVVAVLLHGVWNLAATSGISGYLAVYGVVQVPLFLGYLGFLTWARRREGRLIARHLAPYADAGWLGHEEVRMLASMPLRRSARQWARRMGGTRGLRAMRAFQDAASELALLRARMVRGVADAQAPAAEERLLRSVSVSRGVLFPVAIPTRAWPGARG